MESSTDAAREGIPSWAKREAQNSIKAKEQNSAE
jgi:hypothetical protein